MEWSMADSHDAMAGRADCAAAPRRRWPGALAIALLVALANLIVWRLAHPPLAAPDAPPRLAGLAYNAFQRFDSPLDRDYPADAQIDADLRLLATMTPRLRTYSAAEFPQLPALAERHGLKLALGIWLDRRVDNNHAEIEAAIAAAHRHRSIERLIVGNETQLHRTLAPAELHAALRRVRSATALPVSTAEPWHVWVYQPELARHVDFITVHLLPYWEGVSVAQAVDDALMRLRLVRERHPGKTVVIGEIGWPSGGNPLRSALATPDAQAAFVREFLVRTRGMGLDYYLMEAIDQPWKRATEGAVGAHWGLLDASRTPKFGFSGPLQADPYWRHKALLASLLGAAALLPFLLAFARMRLAGRIAFAVTAQAVASAAVMLASLPLLNYLSGPDVLLLLLLVPALLLMGSILLAQAFEFAETFWPGSLRRTAAPRPLPQGVEAPMISIHLACCNEPPQMVIAAIDSLRALHWPNFEVLVVDNNSTDAACWTPVKAHVDALAAGGEGRVRFTHLPHWPGYKAGALNFALHQTDARAAWVAVVDADYQVRPDWLRGLAGWLAEADVGAVQSPQAHRDWGGQRLRRMMNWEYDGFFRIGMHHRHERDAIVQHGTMTLIRAEVLRRIGGWAEDCICEDTELGLRLLQQRLRVVYVDKVFGTGLVPADFGAYRRQRRRWAQGAMQILRRHAGALFGRSALSLGQRYHFVAGWLPWIGDALHLVFSLGAMAWTVGVLAAPQWFGLPIALFVVPLAVFFSARLLLVPLLYARRVPCGAADIAGASLAGMALSHSVARGVFAGLSGRRAVFDVTRKSAATALAGRWHSVREEAALLGGLLCCLAAVLAQPPAGGAALAGWLAVLVMQALPYAAALACAGWSQRQPRRSAQAVAAPLDAPAALRAALPPGGE
jgi:exo-beta-1,3-glucanase (GH17 family)/cellulose synthase/poly-beta-1,6-N-acetylglucosamine synthase-like glycosyltransferase